MGYSPKMCPTGESTGQAENHWKVTFDVRDVTGTLIEEGVVRTVFNDDSGKQYITYEKHRYQPKKLHRMKSGKLVLRLSPVHPKGES